MCSRGEPDPARPAFVISMPPPNITGRLHAGHGSTYTPMDVLTRYHRMLGEDAVWLPGQDHAAIATEAVMVRELAKEGLTREGLGREKYLERVWAGANSTAASSTSSSACWVSAPIGIASASRWMRVCRAAVARAFVQLYRDGLIYRGTRLVNWDPKAGSTVSDAEVDNEERDGFLWHIRYPSTDGTSHRDCHDAPGDDAGRRGGRRPSGGRTLSRLHRQELTVPFAGRVIPVVADEAVEREFGTGAVKVTPAHDRYRLRDRPAATTCPCPP